MKFAVIFFALCLVVAMMTACGQSVDDVKHDAEISKACVDGGGHVYYNDFGIACSFKGDK